MASTMYLNLSIRCGHEFRHPEKQKKKRMMMMMMIMMMTTISPI
jgi:hypothetical protein